MASGNTSGETVIGIDVGGENKGFHAVALRHGDFIEKTRDCDPAVIAGWCVGHGARVVAVDAPCRWSRCDSSRQAERELKIAGEKIHCFATPTREVARANRKGFYGWVFNAEKLYAALESRGYPVFDGNKIHGQVCIETFPHAIVCAMAGKVVRVEHKVTDRREALRKWGYDDGGLPNIDFVDAALCAVAAEEFRCRRFRSFGDRAEGFIVVPARGNSCPILKH